MSERKNVLLLTGPHGAGKDSVEKALRTVDSGVSRIVRHITRRPSSEEQNEVDYHFVSREEFRAMITAGDELIEYAEYPDVLSGTSYRAINKAVQESNHAALTLNVEDTLPLLDKLKSAGYTAQAYFVSPVALDVFTESPDQYLAALRARMEARQRPDDRIENKLGKAILYRTLYFENSDRLHYIANLDAMAHRAVSDIRDTL